MQIKKLQVKYLFIVNSSEIICSGLLSLTLKLLRKPFFGQKSLFHLFWNCVLHFLPRVTLSENSRSSVVLRSCRCKQKEISVSDVLMLLQKNLIYGYFHNLAIFHLNRKQFSGEIKSDILTLLTLPSDDVKSTVFLRVTSLTKVQVRNFSLLHFLRWLCLIRMQFNMYLRHVKKSVMSKFQWFCIFDIQKRSVFS